MFLVRAVVLQVSWSRFDVHDRRNVAAFPKTALDRPDVRYRVYREDDWKLVTMSDGTQVLFDLAADPSERANVAETKPAELARLTEALETWRAALGLPELDAEMAAGKAPALDAAAQERLKALGYVE